MRHFCYGRVFGHLEIILGGGSSEDMMLPCIISIVREKTSPKVELTVTTQDGRINIHIQAKKRDGPTWDDVQWKFTSHSLRVEISKDLQIVLRLWEQDFRAIWGISDYTMKVITAWQPEEVEDLIFDETVAAFHHVSDTSNIAFPSGPLRDCIVRLYERNVTSPEGTGQRKVFGGYRVAIMTPPTTKSLSSVSYKFGSGAPIMYSNLRGDGNVPALLLTSREANKKISMVFSFQDIKTRARLLTQLTGEFLARDELVGQTIQLVGMTINALASGNYNKLDISPSIKWQHAKVINQGTNFEDALVLFSRRLRICITCNYGTIVDRVNLGSSGPFDCL